MSIQTEVTFRDAIRAALDYALESDSAVVLLGEDIGEAGGVFKVTEGLYAKYGGMRVMDTPISETGFTGAAIGLGLAGYKPVIEIMFADFVAVAFDQIVNQAAKYFYLSAGQMSVPLVIRVVGGAGLGFACQHSQTTESWYLPFPGIKVVVPATVQDGYDLLLASIADPNPVIFIEHKSLYMKTGVLETNGRTDYRSLLGKAVVEKSGQDVTIVASLAMVWEALNAAYELENLGISAEVINIRTLEPLDWQTICQSVNKTSRLIVVEEQPLAGGWGGYVVSVVVEKAFYSLDAPPKRICMPGAPVPFSRPLEQKAIPSASDIKEAVMSMLQ